MSCIPVLLWEFPSKELVLTVIYGFGKEPMLLLSKIGMIADLGMWYLCCGEGICDVWIPAGRILALFYCILLNEHGKYSKIIIILMTYAVKECAKRSDIVYREILGTFEERDIVG